jgi:hypothetical protein
MVVCFSHPQTLWPMCSRHLVELIQQHYELVFVDVGFLDKGRGVVQQFDVPHFYATPTVLIIDPSSGALLNDEDHHIWARCLSRSTWRTARFPL